MVAHKMLSELMGRRENAIGDRMKRLEKKWSIIKKSGKKGTMDNSSNSDIIIIVVVAVKMPQS
jgi:hypothetical protein